jgi:hypothetical protein
MSNLVELKQHHIGEKETTIYVGITPSTTYMHKRLQVKFLTVFKQEAVRGVDSTKYNINVNLPVEYKFKGHTAPLDGTHMDLFMQTLQEVAPGKYQNVTFVEGYWEEFEATSKNVTEDEKVGILLLDGDLYYGHLNIAEGNIFPQNKTLSTIYKNDILYEESDTLINDLTMVQKIMLKRLRTE